jgi:hypothetical protein
MLNKEVGGSSGGLFKVSSTGKPEENRVTHSTVLASPRFRVEQGCQQNVFSLGVTERTVCCERTPTVTWGTFGEPKDRKLNFAIF